MQAYPWTRAALACLAVALVQMPAPPRSTSAKKVVAHRGASAYAPEHTLGAHRPAIEQGADYVEQELDRTTNVEELFPTRFVINPRTGTHEWLAVDLTLDEIKQLDAGGWFDVKFRGERVPTWSEAVQAVGA